MASLGYRDQVAGDLGITPPGIMVRFDLGEACPEKCQVAALGHVG
jgi:hypothetical protein